MVSFEDHIADTESAIRPVLLELRTRINALDRRVDEKPTAAHGTATEPLLRLSPQWRTVKVETHDLV